MKKLIALLLCLTLVFGLVACTTQTPANEPSDTQTTEPADTQKEPADTQTTEPADAKPFKVGVILVHDENSGYDMAHIEGVKAAQAALGLSDDQIVYTLIGSIGIDAEEFDFIEQTVVEDEYISPAASEEEEVKVTYNSIGVALSGALAAVALFFLFIGRHSPKLGAILQKKSSMIVLFGLALRP